MDEDINSFDKEIKARVKGWTESELDNTRLNKARKALHPLAEKCRDLTKQIDLAAKLIGRIIDIAVKELNARDSDNWSATEIARARRSLEDARIRVVEALHVPRYFIKQADWLQERFPDAKLRDVDGLVKLAKRANIKSQDWSLTPGRYVGIAPEEIDEDFDFEEALRSIHSDLKDLNEEATELAERVADNFEELLA